MRHLLRPLPLVLSLLIAACATAPVSPPEAPPPRPEAPVMEAPSVAAPLPTAPQAPVASVWERLRTSFAFADCAADPAVDTWAHRYTRSPNRFEAQMRRILPRLDYVEESAARHGVPGEFVLLPWVESHFHPVPPRKNRPAGMWQIMSGTARQMGLSVESSYDGRLDLTQSTDKVMALLKGYHDYFQDWRLADYAYNAGRYGIDRLVNLNGAPPAEPAVPTLPVRAGTRTHLIKLMAIACVVREPERFHVVLPTLDEDQQLITVEVDRRLSLRKAADKAGLPLTALVEINAGYRNGTVDTRHGGRLLLPRRNADQLRAALDQAAGDSGAPVASINAEHGLPALDNDEGATAAGKAGHDPSVASTETAPKPHIHVVHRGDTLFQLARRYHVHVAQLKRWNNLDGNAIRIGQKLTVSAPD